MLHSFFILSLELLPAILCQVQMRPYSSGGSRGGRGAHLRASGRRAPTKRGVVQRDDLVEVPQLVSPVHAADDRRRGEKLANQLIEA